ncbi:MAG: hypothetical protein UZ19_OD1000823 [Parcubacteria bacterium OLB19]|nr:MAG: hypothetical protein UZ19_OD1000823 [Parcubacteria bacterium OLB19]
MTPLQSSTSISFDQFFELGFYLILIFYIIFSAILYYHWKEYSVDEKATKITLLFYFILTIPLLSALGITAMVI